MFGCTLFAAALFVYVFYQPGEVEAGEEKTRHMYLQERKDATYENLRDLNFEYKAGKLSEQDYAVQRASLEDEAAAILAEMESIEKARSVVRTWHPPPRRAQQWRPRVRVLDRLLPVKISAAGATELSPALQRWVSVVYRCESRRDGSPMVASRGRLTSD